MNSQKIQRGENNSVKRDRLRSPRAGSTRVSKRAKRPMDEETATDIVSKTRRGTGVRFLEFLKLRQFFKLFQF